MKRVGKTIDDKGNFLEVYECEYDKFRMVINKDSLTKGEKLFCWKCMR